MMYFVTLCFLCKHVEQIKIEDHFGMSHGITINYEWPLVCSHTGYLEAKDIERKGFIKIRNKFIIMKATDSFIKVISDYLQAEAGKDAQLAAKMQEHPEKTAEAACNYIMSEVQKEGRCGYKDEEIYGMAIHFMTEDSIKDPGNNNGVRKVVVNKAIPLSQEEKNEAKKMAIEEYQKEVQRKASEEAARKAQRDKEIADRKRKAAEERREKESKMQLDLFGF